MSETDIAGGGAVIESVGDARTQSPLPERCHACGTRALGPYCHRCGQKNDDCRRSIWRLGGEALRDLTALDGRFARTLRGVALRPGRHLRAYGDGKRSPFTPPIRLFLVALFVFFASLELTDRQLLVAQVGVEADEDGETRFGGGSIGFLQPTPERYTPEEREALRRSFRRDLTSDDEEVREPGAEPTGGTVTLNGETVELDRLAEAAIRAVENPRAVNAALHDWTLRILLLLVPLLALFGAALVRGRDALLYDHLLLSLQTHAVAFMMLTAGLWLAFAVPGDALAGLFFLGMPAYYAIALRGAFARSWRKTLAATFLAFALYGLIAAILLVIAVGFAFVSTV